MQPTLLELASFNDGICDDDLNHEKYNFDNGDCCLSDSSSRATCNVCYCNITTMKLLNSRQFGAEICEIYFSPLILGPSIRLADGTCDPSKLRN